MPTVYETEFWRVRLPDGWKAREADGEANVQIQKEGGVGVLGVVTTDDEPKDWWCGQRGQLFHGQLYGRTGEFKSEQFKSFSRWWTFWCGNLSVYVSYRCPESVSDIEGEEVDEMILSLQPKSIEGTLKPLFS